jgi:RHS repeat-associated protein
MVADYKPFGEATVTISTITNHLRNRGEYYDSETGLHYNYFRGRQCELFNAIVTFS